MFPFLIKAKNIVLDAFFPPICLNCRKTPTNTENDTDLRGKLICNQCFNFIKLNNTLFCPVCRSRLAENEKICHFDSPYLLAAAGNYDDDVLRNLIHSFKYQNFRDLSPILGEILLKYIGNCKLPPFERSPVGREIENFIVIPVPLHPKRERQRGFNQAKLLAEIVARKFNLELSDILKRTKNSEPQAKIKDIGLRAKNMENCFEMKNPGITSGKNIVLVDDVFTSGATAGEAVKILKADGAKKIIVLVLAKA